MNLEQTERKQISENYFIIEENVDFTSVQNCTVVNNGATRELQDYRITLDMAKEIAMLQRNEKGKEIRRKLIELEKALYGIARVIEGQINEIESKLS